MPKASHNIMWLSVSRVLGLVLLFFAYTQLFRYLGPFGTGQYQFVLSLVTIFGVIIDLGISQYVTKRITEEPQQVSKLFHTFFAAEVFLAGFIYALMVAFVFLRGYEPVVERAVLVAGVGLFCYGLTTPYLAVLSAFQDLKKVAAVNLLASAVNAAVIFAAIHFNQGIVFLALNQVIYGISALVVYQYLIKQYIPRTHLLRVIGHVDVPLLKKMVIAALPFALLVSFSTVYNRIDIVLITRLLGYEQTGLYAAAYKVVDLTNFFPAVVSHSLYPVLAGFMAQKAIGDVRATLEKYMRFMVALALPMAMLGSLLSKELILILTSGDERFLPAAPVLAVLMWAIAVLFIYVTANSLVVSQLTKWAVVITGVNVVVNVVGNLILLPRYGVRGAAIMTVVSETLQGAFYFYFIWKNITHFAIGKILLKPLFATACMGLIVWGMRYVDWSVFTPLSGQTSMMGLIMSVSVTSAVGVGVYGVVLFLTSFFKDEDKRMIYNLLKIQ
ncbi:MAG: flippase [Candidatus Doudnabacteria bacterium]|nr:flippase [Candidatus Doudnabacteria bacterium]